MSRLTEMIPENEDKLAWLLGVPRGGCFKYHDKVYKADDTEGPSGAGPLNPLYKNDISNL